MRISDWSSDVCSSDLFVPRGEDYDLRWFTPAVEVDLCGHATLASAWVVFSRLDPDRQEVRFHTRSGILTVRRNDDGLAMDLPANPPRPIAGMGADTGAGTAAMLSEALGAVPDEVLETRDHYLAVFAGQARVRDLAPDAGRLLALDQNGRAHV